MEGEIHAKVADFPSIGDGFSKPPQKIEDTTASKIGYGITKYNEHLKPEWGLVAGEILEKFDLLRWRSSHCLLNWDDWDDQWGDGHFCCDYIPLLAGDKSPA